MTNANNTRFTLIQRIQQEERDEHCWEDFVDCYQAYIFVIIKNFGLETTLCQDILQNVLIQLWKDLPKFEYRPTQCRFRTWLSIVTCNVVKTYLKSKAGRNDKQNVEYEEAYHAVDKISESEIESISEAEWKVFITEKAMENLKPVISEKIMTVLQGTFDGKSSDELAEKLNTTQATIRVYRRRGKNALKKEILRLNAEMDAS